LNDKIIILNRRKDWSG